MKRVHKEKLVARDYKVKLVTLENRVYKGKLVVREIKVK